MANRTKNCNVMVWKVGIDRLDRMDLSFQPSRFAWLLALDDFVLKDELPRKVLHALRSSSGRICVKAVR